MDSLTGKEWSSLKVALLVLAGTESHEGRGRVHNALEIAKELKESGGDVAIVFDGAGTQGAAAFAEPSHRAHALFAAVQDKVHGACEFCAGAFGVRDQLQTLGVPLLAEYERHPSVQKLLASGYQVISF